MSRIDTKAEFMNSVFPRRLLLFGSAGLLTSQGRSVPVSEAFDHLLLGISNLEHGIEWFKERAGVQAELGGVHPGRGTRNALASLGGKHYLEIIAPDPAQTGVKAQYPIAGLREPRLINFAVKTGDIEQTAKLLQKAGVATLGVKDGSRRTASGALLRWRSLAVESDFTEEAINPIPFFIEWANDSIHPATNAPVGCAIENVHFEHPRAEELTAMLRAMGLDANASKADRARIFATIRTPKGVLKLS